MVIIEVAPHDAVTVPPTVSVSPSWVHVMVHEEPVALDEHDVPSAASVPHRHSDSPSVVTVQHAVDDVLDEHPSGVASPTAAKAPTPNSVHTFRMLLLTLAIAKPSPPPDRPGAPYGTGSDVTPFCLAASHPSSTPVGPSFVLTILNSTRRFCSHAVSLCPGSRGQNSP